MSEEKSIVRAIYTAVLLISLVAVATANLWGPLETSEARYAEISREMVVSGDWIHPCLLNVYHYHKPPITYWITALAYSVFGVTPFAFRFFLIVALGIQFILVVKIGRLLWNDQKAAVLAGWIYVTLPIVLISVRALTTDAYLITFILLAVFSWVRYLVTRQVGMIYLFAVALGLGFLTKGPVVFILPVMVILSLLKWKPVPQTKGIHILGTSFVFLIIALSWFVVVAIEKPQLIDYFVMRHTVERLIHASVFNRSKPWYYYLTIFPLVSVPWIVIFLRGFKNLFNKNANHLFRSIVIYWIFTPLFFFSLESSKLTLYILTLFAGFSLATGYLAVKESSRWEGAVFAGLILTVLLGMIVAPFMMDIAVSFWFFVIPATSALAVAWSLFFSSTSIHRLVLRPLILVIGLLACASVFFRINSSAVNATTKLTDFIQEQGLQNRHLILFDELLPSIAFELNNIPLSVYNGNRALNREVQFQNNDDWKEYLVDCTTPDGQTILGKRIDSLSVIITKSKKIKPLEQYISGSWKMKRIDQWIIFYK